MDKTHIEPNSKLLSGLRGLLDKLRFRWSIATILTVGMVLIIALLMGVSALLDIRHERAIFRERLEVQGLLLLNTISELTPGTFDSRVLDDIILVAKSQPNLSFFEVFDADAKVMASFEREGTVHSAIDDDGDCQ